MVYVSLNKPCLFLLVKDSSSCSKKSGLVHGNGEHETWSKSTLCGRTQPMKDFHRVSTDTNVKVRLTGFQANSCPINLPTPASVKLSNVIVPRKIFVGHSSAKELTFASSREPNVTCKVVVPARKKNPPASVAILISQEQPWDPLIHLKLKHLQQKKISCLHHNLQRT